MANSDAYSGFRPAYHFTGGTIREQEYTIADLYGSNILAGDMVKSTGTGRNIAVCVAGDRALGVFAGCRYVAANGDVVFRGYWPASTDAIGTIVAYVYDDPWIVFEVQAGGTLGIAATDVNQMADMVSTHAGSTSTGRSGQEVDDVGQLGLKVLGLIDRPANDYGVNAKVYVLINEHENRSALTAV